MSHNAATTSQQVAITEGKAPKPTETHSSDLGRAQEGGNRPGTRAFPPVKHIFLPTCCDPHDNGRATLFFTMGPPLPSFVAGASLPSDSSDSVVYFVQKQATQRPKGSLFHPVMSSAIGAKLMHDVGHQTALPLDDSAAIMPTTASTIPGLPGHPNMVKNSKEAHQNCNNSCAITAVSGP